MINKYPGTCSCGTAVAAGAGEAVRENGRWVVRCGCAVATSVSTNTLVATDADITSSDTYTLISGHVASDHQAAVFDHFRTSQSSAIIKACAGSGKTTSIKNAIRYLPEWMSVQLLAFNVEAASQLKAAIEEVSTIDAGKRHYRQVRANTFHSVCMQALRRYLALPDTQIKVDDGKVRRLMRERIGNTPIGEETVKLYSSFVTQLVGLAKGEGIGCLVPDTDERWWGIIDHHGLYLDSAEANEKTAVEIARRVMVWSEETARAGWLDYNDQLYLTVLWKLNLWQNHVVIIDEAQDTSPIRRAIARLLLRKGGRLYAIGDPKQSIYGFCGASTEAMNLIASEFNAKELPLTVSYRCAKSVVERAKTWVPYIEASDFAPEGEVLDDAPLANALEMLSAEDAVLCRQTAPLVSLAYGLISRGRACRILGRDIGEGLVNLIEQQRAKGIDNLIKKLETWRNREVSKFNAKGEEGRAEAVEDRVDCIMVLINALSETERTIPTLVRKISSMFDDDKKGQMLTLSTCHKSKGKEWDRVAILRPELMPSKAARQEWQQEQEINLMYVAATRAKETLIYCLPEDMALVKPVT